MPDGTPFVSSTLQRFGSGNYCQPGAEWPGVGEVKGTPRDYSPGVRPFTPLVPGVAGNPLDFIFGALWSERGTLFRDVRGEPITCAGGLPFGIFIGGAGIFGGPLAGVIIGGDGVFTSGFIPDGGTSINGSALVSASYLIIGDGGTSLNGSSPFISSYPLTSDGGTSLNGSSPFVSEYEPVGDGGTSLNGSADIIAEYQPVGDGGTSLNGSAIFVSSYPITGDGGTSLNGSADVIANTQTIGDGGTSLNGSAIIIAEYQPVGDGGTSLNGSASIERALVGNGGTSLNGSATLVAQYQPVGDGGTSLNGSATLVAQYQPVGDGGTRLNGSATLVAQYQPVGDGGTSLNGSANVSSSRPVTGDGGTSLNGSAAWITGTTPVPGLTCGAAADIPLDYVYHGTAVSTVINWFKYTSAAAAHYKLTITNSSANRTSVDADAGSCATPISVIGGTKTGAGTWDWTVSAGQTIWFPITGLAAGTYTFTVSLF